MRLAWPWYQNQTKQYKKTTDQYTHEHINKTFSRILETGFHNTLKEQCITMNLGLYGECQVDAALVNQLMEHTTLTD